MSIQPVKHMNLKKDQPFSGTSTTAQPILSPPPVYTYYPSVTQMEHGAEEDPHDYGVESPLSPIALSISSPISVIGDGNLIAIDGAQMACNIAHSIVRTIKDASMCNAGIPMIDEEGRPRPIEVRVDAPMRVEGSKNMVGERAIFLGLQADLHSKRRREQSKVDEAAQKEMNESEAVEIQREGKRQKVQKDS